MLFETADMVFFSLYLYLSLLHGRFCHAAVGWSHRSKNHEAKAKLCQQGKVRGGGGAMKSGFDGVEWNDGGIRSRDRCKYWVQ